MKLAIIGYGEMGIELYNLIVSSEMKNEYSDVFYVDFEEDKLHKVMAESDFFETDRSESEILIAMGEPSMRRLVALKYEREGFKMGSFIHPMSIISGNTRLGEGCIVLPFAYMAPNTVIGKNTLLHSGCRIENDCTIGDNCFVGGNSYVGAKTKIDNTCFIGPNAVLRDGLKIGHDSIIGMGAVLTKSVEVNSVYYGNPAKKIRDNENHKVFR